MVAKRITPAPSNGTPPFGGTAYMEAVNVEATGLWQYATVPATVTAGGNNVLATCDVPILANAVGQQFGIIWTSVNTGAMTLRIDLKTQKPLRDSSGNALPAGYTAVGRYDIVVDMGAEYRVATQGGSSGGSGSNLLRAVLAYQKPRGTNGGTGVGATRTRYPLNVIVSNTIPGLTLDVVTNIGRITLPARSYSRIYATAFFGSSVAGGMYLRNITDGADFTGIARRTDYVNPKPELSGSFDISAAKQVELQYYLGAADGGALTLGAAVNDSGLAVEQFGYIIFESFA